MTLLGIEFYEWVGYAASVVVLTSFLMKNIIYLRYINLVGCGLFVTYGAILSQLSVPIIVTNGAIMFIHIYYLFLKSKPAV